MTVVYAIADRSATIATTSFSLFLSLQCLWQSEIELPTTSNATCLSLPSSDFFLCSPTYLRPRANRCLSNLWQIILPGLTSGLFRCFMFPFSPTTIHSLYIFLYSNGIMKCFCVYCKTRIYIYFNFNKQKFLFYIIVFESLNMQYCMELIEIKIDSEFRKHLAYTRRRDRKQ